MGASARVVGSVVGGACHGAGDVGVLMTLRNRLIAEAKKRPAEIVIRQCDVNEIARHASDSWGVYGASVSDLCRKLRAGEMKLLGVPIRVSGEVSASDRDESLPGYGLK